MGFADQSASMAVDATFAAFGKAASYSPPGGGSSVSCVIIRAIPDRVLGLSQGAPLMQGDEIEVRTSEVSSPAKGGTLTLAEGGAILTILSDPRCEDPDRLVWTMTVG